MTDKPHERAGLSGSLRAADGKGIVHIEACLEVAIEEVWSALSDPKQLGRWLGAFEGDLRAGGAFRARFFASEWEGSGFVEVCNPPQRVLVRMTEAGATDLSTMEVTLDADGQQTQLVVEQRGVPLDQLAAYGAGAQVHVEDLASHLAGRERCDARARWGELFPSYRSKPIDPA